jgi:signal transduction histidine kinase/CheY-like chemotaxis protein
MRRLFQLRSLLLWAGNAAESPMVVAIGCLVMPLMLFIGASWVAYGEVQQQANDRLLRTLDLLYVSVRATFDSEYLVTTNVAELIDGYANAEIRANEAKLHDQLGRLVEGLPQVEDVWVLDESGAPLVTAKVFPLPQGYNFADRAYFKAHRGGVERYVSELVRGRVKDIDFFQYSLRRHKPDGSFNGVIAVSILPGYFARLFERAIDIPKAVASIARADGEILVRYPGAGSGDRIGPESGFMKTIAVHPDEGRYELGSGMTDGVQRAMFYRKIPDLPVYVAHGDSTAAVTQAWINRMASHLIFGVPATLGLFLLALLASRRARYESAALARLREEQVRRENAEESLRQSQKMDAVGQLTAGIAHDFNNLLTGIGGAVEMVGRRVGQSSPEITRFLDLARAGVSRAATLTQRLLAFSRQQPLQIEAVDANKLVSGMSDLLRRTLGEQVHVETVLGGGLWRANADAVQLESAVLNLAINGRDAMPGGGTLTIETANAHLDDAYARANAEVRPGQYVLVAVSDTGTGMEPETIARAFEPFYTTKQRGQGTGLGLSMTFGYVKQVGGHLKIYSEVGRGTTVKIYLPRALAEGAPEAETVPAQVAAVAGGGTVVLVVEDDPVVREFAISACREIGCTVYQAENGAQAIAQLEAHDDIALLFTDVGLPGNMNGRQLAGIATERWPALKVLFTTGYTANAIVHHGVLDHGVNFIGKPFSISALAAKIKSIGF